MVKKKINNDRVQYKLLNIKNIIAKNNGRGNTNFEDNDENNDDDELVNRRKQ